jgi:predicted Ser/Thr protein kinase
MTTPRPDPRIGTDLGPYRIEAVIGRGGMGVVYLAEERRLKRRVALKILPPGLADDADYRARFERESQMAAAIDDPNILPIYEAGEIDGVLFIAMRYVEGTDLEARLRDGPLEPRQVVHLLGQVASALDAAHIRGLVHRDVKPGNVLIAAGHGDERGEHAYLTDFGLTKLRTQDTSLTRVGTIMGTLDTMAPEQLEGRDIDGAADQYALAAIAFRALTGKQPFERDSEAALITAILRDPPPSAFGARPDLPAAVDPVLARGMAKRPADRFANCAALVAELRSALGVTSTTAAVSQGGRDRRQVVVAVGALGVLLAGLLGLGFFLGGGTGPEASASPSIGASSGASPNPDPSAFPNADEAALLALLPPDVALRCRRGSYDNVLADSGASSRPLADLACTLAGRGFEGLTPDRVSAMRLRDSTLVTADRVVSRAVQDHGVPDGDCAAEELPATGMWTPEGPDVGRVACWIEGGDAVVEWSHDRDRLVFRVARANRDEGGAIGLWQSIGFAVWAAIREAAGGVDPNAYPTSAEQELLAMLPPDLRDACVRGDRSALETESGDTKLVPVASLSCDLPVGAGADLLEVRWLPRSTQFTPDIIIGFEARVRGIEPGDCATTGRAHGRWSIGGEEVGAVVCYKPTGRSANVSWTRTDRNLYLWAIREDGNQPGLWEWFTNTARFIGP